MKKLLPIVHTVFFTLLVLFSMPTFAAGSDVIADTVITGKIKTKIAADPAISVFKVDVSTSKGVAMLSGDVNSDTDADALIQIAQSTDGVKDVDTSNLKVKDSKQPFTDTAITAKVKGTFIREKLFGTAVPASISVETNNGVVYLSGNVKTSEEANNAMRLAKSVSGVKKVESRIEIQGT